MLKALELVGFKSFADRTRFEFPPGITVIVGPNGSGKSNIVDGIKWVLGEQSAKSLRGKDMADVIFKGAGTGEGARKPLNSAEASIILENSDRIFDIDSEEVHVTRRVYRSGESEYLINGEPCRLKDIRDLFRGTGVATDAYSLIEQGKVDQMLQASSKDRRAIFEEAAGISRFKAKKIEAQRRLARVEQNLLRLSDIVEEVERRFRSIKAQASKATRYQESNERLKFLRMQIGQEDWHRFAERLNEIEESRAECNQTLAQASGELEQVESDRDNAEAESTRVAQELGQCESHLADLRERIATRESSASHLQVREDELEAERQRVQRQLVESHQRHGELTRRIARLQAQADDAELVYREAADQVDTLQKRLHELNSSFEASQAANLERSEQTKDLTRQVTTLEKEIDVEKSRLDEALKTRTKLSDQVELVRLDCHQYETELNEVLGKQHQLESDAEQKDSALAKARQQLDATRVELSERQESLADLKSERSGAARRAEVIEELEQKLEGVHAGVRQLIEQSRVRRHEASSDVVGLVADLIQVEVQHAPLIDVALGEVSQHVVLDGEDLLGELLDGQLQLGGRVGLLRLSELRKNGARDSLDLATQPGVIGRAMEMVQCQPAYEPVVEHLLGTTWVVKTLKDGLELQVQSARKARFVTLTGELVEADGTIIAGPRSRSGGLVSRRSELRSLKAQIERLDRQVEEEHLGVVQLQESVAGQESEVQRYIDEHGELAAALADHRLMASSLDQKLQTGREQCELVVAELHDLTIRIEDSERLILDRQQQWTEREASLRQLESDYQRDADQSAEDDRNREVVSSELTTSKVDLAKAEQMLEGFQSRLQHDQADFSRQATERNDLREQLATCQNRRRETRHQRLVATTELAELYLEKQNHSDKARMAAEAMSTHRQSRSQLHRRVEETRKLVHDAEQKLHELDLESGQLEHERQSILSRLRDDYGIEVDKLQPPEISEDEEPLSREEIDSEIQTLKRKINSMGAVNLEALNELSELEARFGALNAQYSDLNSAKDALVRIIDRINADSRKLFTETLEAIRANFQMLYRRSFGGGRADLVLEEGVDVLEAGIDIIATPPGKPEFNNSLLSGGEKALTAVALLLAIFQHRPSPFCVLDEVDAPFDEANIGRFIEVLTGFLKQTRFVIVTHSKKTMTSATTLYGVTMQESGVSKRVSVKFEDVSEDGRISADAVSRESDEQSGAA